MKKRSDLVKRAVRGSEQKRPLKHSMMDLLFTAAFKNLVYPQIWEDPEVDMAALQLRDGQHIVSIASGGCNILNYLSAADIRITAVDLNSAHMALNRLKHAGIRHMPDHETFYRFFGHAAERANKSIYKKHLSPHLDKTSRAYWEARTLQGRRYTMFSRNFYRYGLLGKQIGLVHFLCRLYRIRPERLVQARSAEEQRWLFDNTIGTMFHRPWIRWVCSLPVAVYGLGIPPAQFQELKAAGQGNMADVLYDRLEKLACHHDPATNYFAWQAFGRGYDHEERRAIPPYLWQESFPILRERVDNIDLQQVVLTERLSRLDEDSVDGFVLLDAQDWMKDDQLTDLWEQIDRVAKPGARVAFRTAGQASILPGRVPDAILDHWAYFDQRSAELHELDRSSIYGGFHLYEKKAA